MRSRNLKPKFFKNEQLAECQPLARILFTGLWCVADCHGNLECRPRRLKIDILPYDDCDTNELLHELAAQGLIRFYEVAGVRYINLPTFAKHQNPHKNERLAGSQIPLPDWQRVCDETDTDADGTDSVVVPSENGSRPADSCFLIPDSGFLIPDPPPCHDPAAAGDPPREIATTGDEPAAAKPLAAEALLASLAEQVAAIDRGEPPGRPTPHVDAMLTDGHPATERVVPLRQGATHFPLNLEWQPGPEFATQLRFAGVPPDTPWREYLPEFVLFWRGRGERKAQGQWEHKFVQDIKRKRAMGSDPQPLPAAWIPDARAYDVLADEGVDVDFAEQLVAEFTLQHRESGRQSRNWSTEFLDFARRRWTSRPLPLALEHLR